MWHVKLAFSFLSLLTSVLLHPFTMLIGWSDWALSLTSLKRIQYTGKTEKEKPWWSQTMLMVHYTLKIQDRQMCSSAPDVLDGWLLAWGKRVVKPFWPSVNSIATKLTILLNTVFKEGSLFLWPGWILLIMLQYISGDDWSSLMSLHAEMWKVKWQGCCCQTISCL